LVHPTPPGRPSFGRSGTPAVVAGTFCRWTNAELTLGPGARGARLSLALRGDGQLGGIVTLNYDLLVEYALARADFTTASREKSSGGARHIRV